MNRRFMLFPSFRDKAVTLSYDDGMRQDKRLISIMQRNGLKGTFNINSGIFSTTLSVEEKGRMTEEEALTLYSNSGMEVAVHGYKHLRLTDIDTAFAIDDVLSDRKRLEMIFGRVIKGMAYADGSENDNVITILKSCGIKYSRSSGQSEKFSIPENWYKITPTCHHNNPNLMLLAKKFIETPSAEYYWSNGPKLFYLYGHSFEFDINDNWEVIENFAEYIGNREDVWYATNGQIYEYVTAYDNLQFSIDGSIIYNPSALTVYVEYYGEHVEIPAGKTIKIRN